MLPRLRRPANVGWTERDTERLAKFVFDPDETRRLAWPLVLGKIWPDVDPKWFKYACDRLSFESMVLGPLYVEVFPDDERRLLLPKLLPPPPLSSPPPSEESSPPSGEDAKNEEQEKPKEEEKKEEQEKANEEEKAKQEEKKEAKEEEKKEVEEEEEEEKDTWTQVLESVSAATGEGEVASLPKLDATEPPHVVHEETKAPVAAPSLPVHPFMSPQQLALARHRGSVKKLKPSPPAYPGAHDALVTRAAWEREEREFVERRIYAEGIRALFKCALNPQDPTMFRLIQMQAAYKQRASNTVCYSVVQQYRLSQAAWLVERTTSVFTDLYRGTYDWHTSLMQRVFPGVSNQDWLVEHCEAVNELWIRVRSEFYRAAFSQGQRSSS